MGEFLNKNLLIIPNKYYSNLFILFCLIFLSVFFEILGVGSIFFVVAVISGQIKGEIAKYIIDTANYFNLDEINFILILFVLCFIIKALFYLIFYFYQFKTTSSINSSLSTNLFFRYLNTDYNYNNEEYCDTYGWNI